MACESADEDLFNRLRAEGRELAKNGRLEEACCILQKAYDIRPSFKIKSHIDKMQILIKENVENSLDQVQIADGFHMPSEMHANLYPYQREAIKWMWGLYKKRKGGVLGDDMGLGKTIQIIAFISSMLDEGHIKSALLIMPVSLLENWKREFKKWAPDIVVKEFHSNTKTDRERCLLKVQNKGGVLLTTYGIVSKNFDFLRTTGNGRDFVWDYIVLDEGHKIKNPTKTTKAVHDLYAKHRLVLSGTPVQNNLRELWALYDFVHQGTLLGSLKTFKMEYETPIVRSREKDANAGDKYLGSRIAENLRILIAPYFLRRTKQEVLQSADDKENNNDPAFVKLRREMMIRKNEFVIWTFLTPIQIKIYIDFLRTDRVKSILVTKRSPLVELNILKKICDHPRLLSHRSCIQLGLEGDMTEEEIEEALEQDAALYFDVSNTPDQTLIDESGKMGVLFQLLENLRSEGHRVLFFSMSCRILDIVQKVLKNRQWKTIRLDGKIRKTIDREKVVSAFQNDSSYPILLLTTQVGGVGLTLTGADRVVIYDPCWNPATDAQAVDRAYRIGQTKSVVVYRFVTCGTVEEKIYRRQIFKDSITQQATGASQDPHRYFTSQELRELFVLDDLKSSSTQEQIESLHSGQRKTDVALDEHIAFLYSLDIFGISDHDLMFQGLSEENTGEEANNSFIREKVTRAALLVKLESDLMEESLAKSGVFAKPFTIPLQNANKTSVNPLVDRNPTEHEIPKITVEDVSQCLDKLDLTASEDDLVAKPVIKEESSFIDVKPGVFKQEETSLAEDEPVFVKVEKSGAAKDGRDSSLKKNHSFVKTSQQDTHHDQSEDVIAISDSESDREENPSDKSRQDKSESCSVVSTELFGSDDENSLQNDSKLFGSDDENSLQNDSKELHVGLSKKSFNEPSATSDELGRDQNTFENLKRKFHDSPLTEKTVGEKFTSVFKPRGYFNEDRSDISAPRFQSPLKTTVKKVRQEEPSDSGSSTEPCESDEEQEFQKSVDEFETSPFQKKRLQGSSKKRPAISDSSFEQYESLDEAGSIESNAGSERSSPADSRRQPESIHSDSSSTEPCENDGSDWDDEVTDSDDLPESPFTRSPQQKSQRNMSFESSDSAQF